ncbi:MAG: phosphopantetheine-binding protein [Ilumatobacteraceae bacterium]
MEAHLDRLPEVATSIVVAARSTAGDPRLIGFVLPTAGSIDVEAVRTALADGLPDAYVPSRLVVVDAFPLTPNGKTDRNRLIDMADDALRTTPASETPSSFDGVEAIVAQAWIDELGHQVGRDDNFFEIGGNSLLAVSVYKRLCDRIAVPLALTDVFRFPTVRTLASHIATATGGTGDQGPDQATDRGARRRQALRRRG